MKQLPQNIDMERAILGAILTDQDAAVGMIPELQFDDFYVPSHIRLFDVISKLFYAGMSVDILSVDAELRLRREEKLTAASLCDMVGMIVPAIAMSYMPTLKKLSRARALIRLYVSSTDKLFDLDEPITVGVECATETMRICEDKITGFEPIANPMGRAMRDLEKAVEDGVSLVSAVPSGLAAIDAKIGGLGKGQLIIIGGRPGMGKTSLALTISRNASMRGYPVAFVSAESPSESLALRLLSGFSEVENNVIRTGRLQDIEISRVIAGAARVSALPLSSLDKQRSWDAIKASLRTLKMRVMNLALVAVDYVGLLRAPTREAKRYLEVGRISSEAKELALELGVPFLLLSQLNRSLENRDDKRPSLADLRESGDLEQDADVVLFPYRPAYYDRDFQPRDMMELAIAKNRDGPVGYAELSYNERLTLVEDREIVTTQTEGEQR